jgi:hypothetical protein
MESLHKIAKIKELLVENLMTEVHKGVHSLDVEETGKVIDMIKDLADAESNCYEAMYYKTVIEAMEEGDDDDRYGYNNRRYSSGRYAPKGRGSVMGFKPYVDQEPYVDEFLNNPHSFRERMRGYSGDTDDRYGRSYNSYRNAKRHYTDTHSSMHKEQMKEHANEHIMDTIATVRDIWNNAEPEQRKKIKQDFSNLLNEMTV